MKNQESPRDIKYRQLYSPIWLVLAIVFFVIAVIMTALFIWMATKPNQQPMALPNQPNLDALNAPCPKQPPLLKLPTPLPKQIKDSLTLIDNHLKSLAKTAQNKSALSVNIFYRDKVIWRGHYGSKVYKGSIPPDDNTIYRIGSVTKIFPVILLYKLYEDGIIASLDDPLSKYAPNFHINNPFTGTNITLRQIANQMSGLPREAPCSYRCDNTTSTEQLDLLKSQNLVIEPWTSPCYSNLGYALLGRLLTENLLVNTTFEEWTERQVLQPLGMKSTGFKIPKDFKEHMALPYSPEGKVLPFMSVGWEAPSGDIYSSSSDLMKLAMLFTKADGKGILKRETIRQMLLPDFITRDGQMLWGSPWEIRFIKAFVARQKVGVIDSYNAILSVIPEMEFAVSVLVNSQYAFPKSVCFKTADLIHSILLPALNKTLFDLESTASFPINPKPFLGDYLVTQIHSFTGEVLKFRLTFFSDKDNLVGMVEKNTTVELPTFYPSVGVVLKYINHPRLFQAKPIPWPATKENLPCQKLHNGLSSIFSFEPPGPDGLSNGFSAQPWKVSGKRITKSINT